MKRLLNNRIFLVLMTAIIVGSIGVYAGSQILASDISYRDGTVESALNDLYTRANNVFQMEYLSTEQSIGNVNTKREITKTLSKGKYIISVSYSAAYLQYASGGTEHNEQNTDSQLFSFDCSSNNCVIERIGRYEGKHVSTGTVDSVHSKINMEHLVYYVEIKENTDNILISTDNKTNDYEGDSLSAIISKVG